MESQLNRYLATVDLEGDMEEEPKLPSSKKQKRKANYGE